MRPVATDVARCVVRLCLCVGHTDVLCKTAEPHRVVHGLGWVGLGRDFSVFGGLGWVHKAKVLKI